ncbi:hypothetical protein [Thiosulfativibrio zosterae]|uniref:Uncharacterized protein n=1 Tax=Thiosulfativibrio zosterae TaxID=2675053 RepID=A0A6F8PMW6_9GAMM|nr:hypothetical protein [Thiosulfativibrio zosterae]BBP43340.1 hypothetical protein THMIRHAT_10860 [Thiosulfativibrio zosterae]
MNELSSQKWLKNLGEVLDQIEQDAQKNQHKMGASQAKTDNILTIFFVFILLFALINFYFVYEWTQEAKTLVTEIEGMHEHIASMSSQMADLYQSMLSMREKTQLVPVMNEELGKFVSNMQTMTTSTQGVNASLETINTSMTGVNQDMQVMNGQFHQLNQTVNNLSYHVGEMSRTLPLR